LTAQDLCSQYALTSAMKPPPQPRERCDRPGKFTL
jgi:hypothetical protein